MKRVYMYSTCLGTAIMGKTVTNAISLLQREGVEVVFKKDQTCCGQPSFNTGYFEETKKVALYNARLFDKDYPIVVPSGSCGGMMQSDYLELFHGDKDYEFIKNFSSRVVELSVYLDKILNVSYEDKGEPIKVTWHSNCHALRVAKSVESSKNLIRRFKNVELVDLEFEEECCGFGGTFSVKEPEISNAMAMAKIKDIENSKASCVVSGDGGCLMNISGTMRRNGKDIKAMHLYDFVANRLNGVAI
ncbi:MULTISPECIES: (Fe-S)-binding protein [unclassified Campylobacter]|uniref:(Fe-S)-binding protein n=1 Tax=unclassified Campylobacter TaxID=2593542 RepID=UPI003D33F53A